METPRRSSSCETTFISSKRIPIRSKSLVRRCSSIRNRQFAETDQPVIIDTNSGRSSAVGLSGDLNSSLLKLSSIASERVHTIVMPDQFKRATTTKPSQ